MRNQFANFIALTTVLLLLSACATYSKEQCENFDWYERGYGKAMQGETTEDGLYHYGRTCTERHGVAPDRKAFKAGFKRGLKKFCSPKTAYRFGKSGGEYAGTCPKEKEDKFLTKYSIGFNQYLKRKVEDLESQVSTLEYENSNLRSQVQDLESQNSSLRSQAF